MDIHFGVNVPQIKRSWAESMRAAREFETLGFDSIWVNDHLYGPQDPATPILEAWSLVAALAAVTERVEIGTLVTPAGMRNPAHLGKVIATTDTIAGGRIIAGLGAGWMEREHRDFGMPFRAPLERLGQLRETLDLLRAMWDPAQDAITMRGRYVQVENLVCRPQPPRRVPLLIGGGGEKVTMRIAAESADIWNNAAAQQDLLPHKVEVLRRHCEALGRDPALVAVSQQCLVTLASDDAAAPEMIAKAKTLFGGHLGDPTGALAISGPPHRVVDQIRRHIDLGCTMFMIEFFGRDTLEPARLFAETVLPQFRESST